VVLERDDLIDEIKEVLLVEEEESIDSETKRY
jgi:hypothetical protein